MKMGNLIFVNKGGVVPLPFISDCQKARIAQHVGLYMRVNETLVSPGRANVELGFVYYNPPSLKVTCTGEIVEAASC
jgi:hypothetical protein